MRITQLFRSYLARQCREIAADPVLRRYGCALALMNVLTTVFWVTSRSVVNTLNPLVTPICWPVWPGCYDGRLGGTLSVLVVIGTIAVLSAWSAALFLRPSRVPAAYSLLLVSTVLKIFVVLQDYRLVLNQHYMASIVVLVFALVPYKRAVLPSLIVAFYVAAGLLKFNSEWLSGAALYGRHPFGLPASTLPALCAYVVVLETLLVFGVLSRRASVFWAAFCQVVLFHIASFWVVGYFYPLLMACILCILPLGFLADRNEAPHTVHWWRRLPSSEAATAVLVLVVFAVLQAVPRAMSRDAATTGEGRMFALNMFDAPLECRAFVTIHLEGRPPITRSLRAPYLQPRIQCDPIVYSELARAVCRSATGNHQVTAVDLTLDTRRRGETTFASIVDVKDFCRRLPRYAWWRHNPWIQAPDQARPPESLDRGH
jgi:uncharacterized membrane protein YphA (DoxX/SURF4 family)